jgi:hypothetical protein
MTSVATVVPPLTARLLLSGTAVDTTAALARAMERHGVARSALRGVRWLSASSLGVVERELAGVLEGLLDLDLGEVLVAGWRKHAALIAAGERTAAAPASKEVVELATHRVTWTCRPSVDLVLDGAKLATLEFVLTIEFVLVGVSAVVWQGHLVAVQGGDCSVTGDLELGGADLCHREQRVDIAWLAPLRPAVPLVGNGTTAPHQADSAPPSGPLRRRSGIEEFSGDARQHGGGVAGSRRDQ